MDIILSRYTEETELIERDQLNNSAENDYLSNGTIKSHGGIYFNFTEDQMFKILYEHKLKGDRTLSMTAEIILIIIYSFLIMGGLVTNILVSFVVARRKQMHTARNLYIVNLTISDISLCLICMPFTLIKILRTQWTLGPVLCKLMSVLQGTNIMVSVGTITVIALDRYFTICKRTTESLTNAKRRVIVSILLIWLISFILMLPLMFYQVTEPVSFQGIVLYEACIEVWPSEYYKLTYAVAILLIMAVIPPLVVAIVHARIASYLNEHARTQRDSRRAQKELERNKKTTMLLSGIVIIFAISWLPLGTFALITEFIYNSMSPQSVLTGIAASHVIAMTSAITNPIVYGWLNSNMRHEFLQLLPRSCAARCASQSEKDEVNVGATAVENDTTRTHIHYHCVENDINNKKESYLLVSLNKNLNNNPNSQNFAHL